MQIDRPFVRSYYTTKNNSSLAEALGDKAFTPEFCILHAFITYPRPIVHALLSPVPLISFQHEVGISLGQRKNTGQYDMFKKLQVPVQQKTKGKVVVSETPRVV